ncbi:MAG TPA: hypothetical protein PLF39_08390, partial [Synergistales bacterium]|nr:hypothetical protein [Synergistales bacterium]
PIFFSILAALTNSPNIATPPLVKNHNVVLKYHVVILYHVDFYVKCAEGRQSEGRPEPVSRES